jgi:hypothetical protein
MSAKTAKEQQVCPFTLESSEDVCTQDVMNEQKICSFTLEHCLLDILGSFLHAREMRSRVNGMPARPRSRVFPGTNWRADLSTNN